MNTFADMVQDTSSTTGTGTLTLSGSAPTGFQGFDAIGNGKTCYYSIRHASANEWEIGLGTVAVGGSTTLARTTVLASSNSSAAVNFSSGTKYVRHILPAMLGARGEIAAGSVYALSYSATPTVDLNNGKRQAITLTGAATFSVSNDYNGAEFSLVITQDSTGGRIPTFWSTLTWRTGRVIDVSANATTIVRFVRTGSGAYDAFIDGQKRFNTDFTAFGTLISGLGPNELTATGPLSTWTAMSGASPTQSGTNRPSVCLNGPNGLPCVNFDNNQCQYMNYAASALDLSGNTFSLVCLTRRRRIRTLTNSDGIIGQPQNGWGAQLTSNSGEFGSITKVGVSSVEGKTTDYREWRINTFKLDGTNGKHRVDSHAWDTDAYTPTFTTGLVGYLGNGWGGSGSNPDTTASGGKAFDGQMCLVLVYQGVVSDGNLLAIEDAIRKEAGV